MTNEIRIQELNEKLNSLYYSENGTPIGIDAAEFVAMVDELETLESAI